MEAKHYQNGSHESGKKSAVSHRPMGASSAVVNATNTVADARTENWFKKTNAQLNEMENAGERFLKQGRTYLSQVNSLIREHPLTALAITSAATAVTVYAVIKLMNQRNASPSTSAKA